MYLYVKADSIEFQQQRTAYYFFLFNIFLCKILSVSRTFKYLFLCV